MIDINNEKLKIRIIVERPEDASEENLRTNMDLLAKAFLSFVKDGSEWALDALSDMCSRGNTDAAVHMLFHLFKTEGNVSLVALFEDTQYLVDDDDGFYDRFVYEFIEAIIRADETYLYLEDEAYGEM